MFTSLTRQVAGPVLIVATASLLGCRGGGQTQDTHSAPHQSSVTSPGESAITNSRSYGPYPTVNPIPAPPSDDEARLNQQLRTRKLKPNGEPRLLPAEQPAAEPQTGEIVVTSNSTPRQTTGPVLEPLESERRLAPTAAEEPSVMQRFRAGLRMEKLRSMFQSPRDPAPQAQIEHRRRSLRARMTVERKTDRNYAPFSSGQAGLVQTQGEADASKYTSSADDRTHRVTLPVPVLNPVSLEQPQFLGR